jgi:phosphoribosylglycinamide formyltransferase-1
MTSPRFAYLASGAGSTVKYLFEQERAGRLNSKLVCVVADRPDCGALFFANEMGLNRAHFAPKEFKSFGDWDKAMCAYLVEQNVTHVFLLGFLRKVGPLVLEKFKGRIFNTHPSLLPKYGGSGMYGIKVHEAVIAAKEKSSGVSIHHVTDEYDSGAVAKQAEVHIHDGMNASDLETRVKQKEKELLVEFINKL